MNQIEKLESKLARISQTIQELDTEERNLKDRLVKNEIQVRRRESLYEELRGLWLAYHNGELSAEEAVEMSDKLSSW